MNEKDQEAVGTATHCGQIAFRSLDHVLINESNENAKVFSRGAAHAQFRALAILDEMRESR